MPSNLRPADAKVVQYGQFHYLDHMRYQPLVAELTSGLGFKGAVEIEGHCMDWIPDGYLLDYADPVFQTRGEALKAANAMLIERLNILDVSPERLKFHLNQGTRVILAPVGPRIDMSALAIATVTSLQPKMGFCIGFDEDADEYPPEYTLTKDGRLDAEDMAHLGIVGIVTTPGDRAKIEATFKEHHAHLQSLQPPSVTFVAHEQMFGLAHNHSIVIINDKSYVLKEQDGHYIAEGEPQDLRFDDDLRPVSHTGHIAAIALVQGRPMKPAELDAAWTEHSRVNGVWSDPIINTDLHALYHAPAGTEISLLNAAGAVFRAVIIDAEVPMAGAPAIRLDDGEGNARNTRISTSTGLVEGAEHLVFGGLHHVTDHSLPPQQVFDLAGRYLEDDDEAVLYRQHLMGVLNEMGADFMGQVPISNMDNDPSTLQVCLRNSYLILSDFPSTGQVCHYDLYQTASQDLLRRISTPQVEPLIAHLDAYLTPAPSASNQSTSVRLGM
ncbi:hypothetical protein ACWATP_002893 [Pseudomonas aeruginosa]|nr:hypothetical protein [Pseudomonas aeruginosa]